MKHKAVIYLFGGMGNNLFQLALGQHLVSQGYVVEYNNALTKKNLATKIMGWTIHNDELMTRLLANEVVHNSLKLSDFIFLAYKILQSKLKLTNLNIYSEHSLKLKSIFHMRYFGYYQSGVHLNETVYVSLSNRLKKLNLKKHKDVQVVVHCRRGDFDKSMLLTPSYYSEALTAIKRFETHDFPIYFFSDDPTAKNEIELVTFSLFKTYEGENRAINDFLCILNATTVVASNSTFCYWAIALGSSTNIVIPYYLSVNKKWDLPLFNKNVTKISNESLFIK